MSTVNQQPARWNAAFCRTTSFRPHVAGMKRWQSLNQDIRDRVSIDFLCHKHHTWTAAASSSTVWASSFASRVSHCCLASAASADRLSARSCRTLHLSSDSCSLVLNSCTRCTCCCSASCQHTCWRKFTMCPTEQVMWPLKAPTIANHLSK